MFSVCSNRARLKCNAPNRLFPISGSGPACGGRQPALQPQKYEPDDRDQDVAVKNDAGVAGSEIARVIIW
jgi:hypothetical protein